MKELFEFNQKCNEKFIHQLLESGFAHKKVIDNLSHILNTHYMWLAKIKNEKYNPDLWSPIAANDLFKANNIVHEKTFNIIEGLGNESTVNLKIKGMEENKSVETVLQNIILHSTHFRAQVSFLFEKFHIPVPEMEFIEFKKIDLIEDF